MIRVRVRGIASTALSKLLVDRGYSIVQASSVIRDRLGLEDSHFPADVTIKDSSEDELLVIGFYDKAKRVYEEVASELEHVFKWISPVGLYSIHVGVVVDRKLNTCTVDLGGVLGALENCKHCTGDRVVVSVYRAPLKPGEEAKLTYSLRVVGEYVSLIYGSPSITFSEHIRDRGKKEYLSAIAVSKLIGSGLGIHFRSSSAHAGEDDILREIESLREQLVKILEECKDRERAPRAVYEGEFIGLMGLTSAAKSKLDQLRSEVAPTIVYHHSFKTAGGLYSELVDFAEKIAGAGRVPRDDLNRAVLDYLREKLAPGSIVRIVHVKPDGSRSELSPGRVGRVAVEGDELEIVLLRVIKTSGFYDGLNVEKREGDVDYMYFKTSDWFVSHNYYRGNEWIGSYINVNTPPEVLSDLVKYHDLAIDVVVKPSEKPLIIDREELEKYCRENVISESACKRALEKASEIASSVDKYLYVKKYYSNSL